MKPRAIPLYFCFLTAFALGCLLPACAHPVAGEASASGNLLVRYFYDAELQVETQSQIQEIKRAFNDALELPLDTLRAQRYADYRMMPNRWTFGKILSAYFCCNGPERYVNSESEAFYADAKKPEAVPVLKRRLAWLDKSLPHAVTDEAMAASTQISTPETAVRAFYAWYLTYPTSTSDRPTALEDERIYGFVTQDAMARVRALYAGCNGEPLIDADYFTKAQDSDATNWLKNMTVSLPLYLGDKAVVAVRMGTFGEMQRQLFVVLVEVGAGWKIYEVVDARF